MEKTGQCGTAAPGPLWSHLAGWHDLLVPVPATDASRLDLEEDWPDRWLVTRRVDGDKASCTVPGIPVGTGPPEPKKKRRPRNTVFDDHGTRSAAGE